MANSFEEAQKEEDQQIREIGGNSTTERKKEEPLEVLLEAVRDATNDAHGRGLIDLPFETSDEMHFRNWVHVGIDEDLAEFNRDSDAAHRTFRNFFIYVSEKGNYISDHKRSHVQVPKKALAAYAKAVWDAHN